MLHPLTPLQTDGDTEGYLNIQQAPRTSLLLPNLSLQRPGGWHDPPAKTCSYHNSSRVPPKSLSSITLSLKVEAPGGTEQVVPKHPAPSHGA